MIKSCEFRHYTPLSDWSFGNHNLASDEFEEISYLMLDGVAFSTFIFYVHMFECTKNCGKADDSELKYGSIAMQCFYIELKNGGIS